MYKKSGFTLIEIMIVIVIIAILATIITPQFRTLIQKSKETKLKENLNILREAIDVEFTKNNGFYPEKVTTEMFKEKLIPSDPIKNISTVVYTTDNPITVISTEGGWIYNNVSGEVRVNNSTVDLNGTPYSKY